LGPRRRRPWIRSMMCAGGHGAAGAHRHQCRALISPSGQQSRRTLCPTFDSRQRSTRWELSAAGSRTRGPIGMLQPAAWFGQFNAGRAARRAMEHVPNRGCSNLAPALSTAVEICSGEEAYTCWSRGARHRQSSVPRRSRARGQLGFIR